MTSAKMTAYRFRRLILITGIIFTTAGVAWFILPFFSDFFERHFEFRFFGLMGTVLAPFTAVSDSMAGYIANIVLFFGLILLSQWAFLRPSKGLTVRLATEGRPLKSSVIAAGIAAMLLTVGFIALLIEIPNWYEPIMSSDKGWVGFAILGVMLVVWAGWSVVFYVYWRQGDSYTQMGKMLRGLIAGSILEIMIAVPVHIWAARQRECYCCRGTYTTLVLAGTVLIWVFGPGIILLYMREKYRQAKLFESENPDLNR
jgi:hypothetical protein